MVEKIGTIRNPLTIIAIFAGITEISGTAVLPFVKSFASASSAERAEKLKEEILKIENEESPLINQVAQPKLDLNYVDSLSKSQNDIRYRYLIVKGLVLNKLSNEFDQELVRGAMFREGPSYIFDAVAFGGDKVTAIEIKYVMNAQFIATRFRDTFLRILDTVEHWPDEARNCFSLIIVVVTDSLSQDHAQLINRLYSLIGVTPFPVEARVFSFEELEKEFGPQGPTGRIGSQ